MTMFPASMIQQALADVIVKQQGSPRGVTALVSDSRHMVADSLFVCIRGEAFDGHKFAMLAVSNGAVAVLCDEIPPSMPAHVWVIQVPDTIAAFRLLAQSWRATRNIPVVAVSGSVGKTTTKELLAAILQGRYGQVLKTEGSQNGFLGIPMTLARLRPEHKAAVVEIGIDEPGPMQEHLTSVAPNAAVVTAIAEEHMENFRDLAQVAMEEMLPLQFVGERGGILAINENDPWIHKFSDSKSGTVVRFHLCEVGTEVTSEAAAGPVLFGMVCGDSLKLVGRGLDGALLKLPLPGRHNAANLLAATAVAVGLELPIAEIRAGLAHFAAPPQRSVMLQRNDNVILIGDYYNASPASMRAALTLLDDAQQRYEIMGKRYVCLGDMLELGPQEERFHRELAVALKRYRVDGVWLYGKRMGWLKDELTKSGFAGPLVMGQDHAVLAESLTKVLRSGDVLLLKGSRGMRLERVWERMLRPAEKASNIGISQLL